MKQTSCTTCTLKKLSNILLCKESAVRKNVWQFLPGERDEINQLGG